MFLFQKPHLLWALNSFFMQKYLFTASPDELVFSVKSTSMIQRAISMFLDWAETT